MTRHRILVTLDTSERGRAALETALQLAIDEHTEMEGLYIEDENLIRLAALPFSCEVDLASALPRELQTRTMEHALRSAAEETQAAFAETLRTLGLPWTFRTIRGNIASDSLAAAGEMDLLVIGQQGKSPRTMSLPPQSSSTEKEYRVVAVFDDSPSSYRTLEFASLLTMDTPRKLDVLVVAADPDTAVARCVSWLRDNDVRAEVNQTLRASPNAVLDYARQWPPDVLVMHKDLEHLGSDEIGRLVDEVTCPLVLC